MKQPKEWVIGSRDSHLAVCQTKLVMEALQKAYPKTKLRLVTMKTTGDKILDRSLDQIGGKGLFVKELDAALLEGRIDLAVHSLKDLPMGENKDLPVGALFQRGDPRDCLVMGQGCDTITTIGSSSARRQVQLGQLYPGVAVHAVRGNIVTRLQKADRGDFSALVLAAAGLERIGMTHRISRYFSPKEMIPAAGQGILAVQCRSDFPRELLLPIHDEITAQVSAAERAFVAALDGGCSSPVAAYGEMETGALRLTGLYLAKDGQKQIGSLIGNPEDGVALGEALAKRLKGGD
jgi:hydroxymethylbilane synthase